MSKLHPFSFQSLPDTTFSFQTAGFFKGWKVLVDGKVCKKKRNKIYYNHPEKGEIVLQVKANLDFTTPSFVVDGEQVFPQEPLAWYFMLWALLPMALAGFGGAIGGAFGGGAFMVNMSIIRSEHPLPVRIALTMVSAAVAVGGWLIVASLFLKAIR